MSETEPEKKGWFARFRSRGAPANETPPSETPQPAERQVEKQTDIPVAPPSAEVAPSPSEPPPEVLDAAPGPDAGKKEEEVEAKGWLSRLRAGLAKSTKRVTESITSLFTKKKLDQETLNELEDALIQADLGVSVAARLIAKLGKERFGKEVTDEEVRAAFADDIAEILQPVAMPLAIDSARKPHVVLVVGVNGSGKTTTIAKMAHLFKGEGRKVMLAAGDTFRAAAVEQLKVWGDRAGVPVISKPTGADAAGLAYEALEKARAEGSDVLLIDTAGRLHNKTNLMEELAKIVRVIRKIDPSAPHSCLLVLDATTGQNAHAQVETFKTMSPIDALVVTKLDGSAKGGVLVALAEKFKLPVVAIGIGEGIDDLRPFEARAFARGLMGLPA
ncbi:fused signal recognition particle receptor [Enhydrobacter aerosaccus]|uniref:Signal recognition particle receptor FtsY n=1 Tax=Enhydrobacter aerosaccus TaxID=225324 RepID=A0A1T4SH86_9HYPH|nr:signal recognition particle-docking protein FtsY [Enhydrobacter aerosaccus]SKA27549.1 fused signal recognition particle receptor [Enhydrobacter aerosaccus]